MVKYLVATFFVSILALSTAWAKDKGNVQPPGPAAPVQSPTPPVFTQQPPIPTAPPIPPQTGTQASAAAGQWACRFSYAELNAQGMQTSGFNREYVMLLYPQGTYEAQGTEAGVSGYSQFYSQGQWQEMPGPNGAMIMAKGSYQSNQPYGIPGMTFGFNAQMQPGGVMSFTYEQPDPYGQYVMNRSIDYCQRQGS